MIQLQDYIIALQEYGLDVTVLEADENFPDSTFVEDVALCTPQCAIITNPRAASRNQEINARIPTIKQHYQHIEYIQTLGTIEAGDIMMVGDHYYIGLSKRTNQMIEFLNQYGMHGSVVTMNDFLHLKTGVNYLENNYLLASGEFIDKAEFKQFNINKTPEKEVYATNSVWINDTILTPIGFPKIRLIIEKLGYKIREVDVSEFQKLDGGLGAYHCDFKFESKLS